MQELDICKINVRVKMTTSGLSWPAILNITAASLPVPPKPGGLRSCFLTMSSSIIDCKVGRNP
jgi:hypothetical protein